MSNLGVKKKVIAASTNCLIYSRLLSKAASKRFIPPSATHQPHIIARSGHRLFIIESFPDQTLPFLILSYYTATTAPFQKYSIRLEMVATVSFSAPANTYTFYIKASVLNTQGHGTTGKKGKSTSKEHWGKCKYTGKNN